MSVSASQSETQVKARDPRRASAAGMECSRIWRSDRIVTIPSTDILTFAFANLGKYDANKPIFVDGNDPLDYVSAQQAQVTIKRLIKGLEELGLKEEDCVCLHSFNCVSYPLLWLGIIGAGGCVAGSNPAYTSSELVSHFNTTGTKYIFAQLECLKAVEEAAVECQIPRSHILLITKPGQIYSSDLKPWQTLLTYGTAHWGVGVNQRDEVDDKIALYATTSGTTGLPKAATIPRRYVVAQSVMVEERFRGRLYQPTQLVCLPVFHAFAAQVGLILPLRLGVTTYFMPRFKLLDFVRIIKTFEVTDIAVVPPVVTALLRLPATDQESLRSLRYIICAGAPMVAGLQTKLYESLSPDAIIAQSWGATELGWVTLFDWNEKDTSGSVGRLMPNTELKIVDEEGNSVSKDGIRGEAYVRSPSMLLNYRNNVEASETAFDQDGFYKTGDLVFFKRNKLFIDGRVKDIMKVNGWQVSPAEIEGVLLQHPKIADAAVVGISQLNTAGLEEILPRAYVVRVEDTTSPISSMEQGDKIGEGLRPGFRDSVTEQEVKEFIASRLISYKQLTGGVFFIDKIPRNSTGKILRRFLSISQPESPVYRSESSFVALSPASAAESLNP